MCWALYTLSRLLFAAVQSLSCLTLCDPTDCSMPGFPVFPRSMFSPLANSMRQGPVSLIRKLRFIQITCLSPGLSEPQAHALTMVLSSQQCNQSMGPSKENPEELQA